MSSDFNFQPFLAVGGSYAQKLSIRSNGSLGLSQGLMHRYGVNKGEWFARLFFDAEKRAIGIKFTNDGNAEGVVKIHVRSTPGKGGQENWSGHISARAFMDYYGIDFKNPAQSSFRPEWNDAFGGIVVRLNDPGASESAKEENLEADPPDGEDAPGEKTPS
jgi:hypothetical protein